MSNTVDIHLEMIYEQNKDIDAAVLKERSRLLNFIKKNISDEEDAEDILQDALFLFIEQYRMPESVEKVSSWLFRVIRNKIIDRFRKKKAVPLSQLSSNYDAEEVSPQYWLLDNLSLDYDDPEARYVNKVVMEEILNTIDELPPEQRDVFVQHEIEGRSFKEIALNTGVQVNTLLSRKRYAILFLRRKLSDLYDEFIYD